MARTKLIGVRFSEEEFISVGAAAVIAHVNSAAWLRDLALRSFASAPSPLPVPDMRPTPLAALSRTVGTRLSTDQFEGIAERAKSCGLPVAAYVRQVVLGVTPTTRRPEMRAAIVALNRVGNNLNQLTKLAHSGTLVPRALAHSIEQVLEELRRLRKSLLEADK